MDLHETITIRIHNKSQVPVHGFRLKEGFVDGTAFQMMPLLIWEISFR